MKEILDTPLRNILDAGWKIYETMCVVLVSATIFGWCFAHFMEAVFGK